MSVYKPAKSRIFQYDFKFKGCRYHGSTGCTSKRDAERYEAEQRRKVALGETTKPAWTIEQACDEWFNKKGQFQKSHADSLYQLGNIIKGQVLEANNWSFGAAISVMLTLVMAFLLLAYYRSVKLFKREVTL